MANLIGSSLSSAAFKLTNATTNTDVLEGISISKVNIKLSSLPLRHMKEDGETIVDSRVIRPTAVSIDAFCKDFDMLTEVNNIAADRSNFYTLNSKGLIISQLMVDSEQIRQTPDVLSAYPIRLSFKQILVKNTRPIIFAEAANSSAINRGMILLNSVTKSVSEIFTSVVK